MTIMSDQYEDIIDLPRPVSTKHPRMSMEDRAAQFAPFAALTGYEDNIKDTTQQNLDSYESKNNEDDDLAHLHD
jgi:hypothetical protein